MVRDEFQHLTLDEFVIHVVDHVAAAACEVDVTLTVDGVAKPGRMRWFHENTDGDFVVHLGDGEWKLVTWGPMAIYNRAAA